MFSFKVSGLPIPQGSKTATVINGRAVMFDSNKKLKAWRQTVSDAASQKMREEKFTGFDRNQALSVHLWFTFERPKTVKRKDHTVKPDIDKLIRSVFDSLTTSGLIAGDEQIIRVNASKSYSDSAGVKIDIHNVYVTNRDTE
jgi:Holliday junction resolvase RusA-like endonuclease